jgi:hypothetical protein
MDAIKLTDAETVWVQYKMVCPNSKEPFSTDPKKVRAWEWILHQWRTRERGRPVKLNRDMLLDLQAERRVRSFCMFPKDTASKYLGIAACYPDHNVYACGSRVRGEYIDNGDARAVIARKLAGMRVRQNSDFDYWVEPGALQSSELPPNSDRCRLRVPEREKVLIPKTWAQNGSTD